MSNIYSTKNVKLVLRTSDAVSTNESMKMYGTWVNVNIPDILGHMSDEFEQFNLVLQHIAQYNETGDVISNANADLFVSLAITGLPFVNQGYDYVTRTHNNRCVFPPWELAPTFSDQTTFTECACTFNKCNMKDITYNLLRTSDGKQAIGGADDFRATFTFYIVGVESSRIHKRIY